MKEKLKKLAKKEMKKRNLTPRDSLVSGEEVIKTFKSFNELPYLPKAFPNLQSQSMQNKAQSFYFVQGSYINNRTNAHIREVLQKKGGKADYYRRDCVGILCKWFPNSFRIS
ncbi:hypothetical protein [Lactococcus petauri]|uniref:hypothetical protein n=1 Tax=Lactococcus petauri TaxID=1940789 RepID=UPI0038543145